jgi:hypothetical protein
MRAGGEEGVEGEGWVGGWVGAEVVGRRVGGEVEMGEGNL